MLLNFLWDLGKKDVASVRQSAIMHEKWKQLMAVIMRSEKKKIFPADDISFSTLEREISSLFVTGISSFLDHSSTVASLLKLAQSIRKLSTFLITARRWKPSARLSGTAGFLLTTEEGIEKRSNGELFAATKNDPKALAYFPSRIMVRSLCTCFRSVRLAAERNGPR